MQNSTSMSLCIYRQDRDFLPSLPGQPHSSTLVQKSDGFAQLGCDCLGLGIWLIPGQNQMGSVQVCVADLLGLEELEFTALPPLAESLCLRMVWSLQTPFLELPRGTNQETCWAEGCGTVLSPDL